MKSIKKPTLLLIAVICLTTACNPDNQPDLFELKVAAEPQIGGTVSPSDTTVTSGDLVEITTSVNEHWMFERWSGDYSGTANPLPVTVTRDMNITAHFKRLEYPLNIQTYGDGDYRVEVIEEAAISSEYPSETRVRVTALPKDGWDFVFWAGDLESRDPVIELTLDEAKTLHLAFVYTPKFFFRWETEFPNAFEARLKSEIGVFTVPAPVGYDAIRFNTGIVWNTTGNPNLQNDPIINSPSSQTGEVVISHKEVEPNRTYYVRWFATNEYKTYYSEELVVTTPKYNIGSIGPGGGYIFYKDTQSEYPFDFIEVARDGWWPATPDGTPSAIFGCMGMRAYPAGTLTQITDGPTRTRAMAENCPEENTSAKMITGLEIGGFTDWYVPSAYEINRINTNLFLLSLPGISPYPTASSTEVNLTEILYGLGDLDTTIPKDRPYPFRPVRFFNAD